MREVMETGGGREGGRKAGKGWREREAGREEGGESGVDRERGRAGEHPRRFTWEKQYLHAGAAEHRGACPAVSDPRVRGSCILARRGREHLRAPSHAGAAQHARRRSRERTHQSMQAREWEGKQPGMEVGEDGPGVRRRHHV